MKGNLAPHQLQTIQVSLKVLHYQLMRATAIVLYVPPVQFVVKNRWTRSMSTYAFH